MIIVILVNILVEFRFTSVLRLLWGKFKPGRDETLFSVMDVGVEIS